MQGKPVRQRRPRAASLQWPRGITDPDRTIDDFVSTTDIAPTFLALAGIGIPTEMTGRSLQNLFESSQEGHIDPFRNYVLTGKERHVMAQENPDKGGTPMRAIRNHDLPLIRNFRPDRWPAGTPNHEKATLEGAWIADCDNGPTKSYMVDNHDKDDEHLLKYKLAFGKRLEYELYDLRVDPDQLRNVAGHPDYAEPMKKLIVQLMT